MPFLKISDITHGFLNNLQDTADGTSGDRRRTDAVTSINKATSEVFSVNTLKQVTELRGIIVSYRQVNYSTYQNRTSMLKNYVYKTSDTTEELEDKPIDFTSYAYKVYIPELECRPVPLGPDDPVLITYPDVFSDISEDSLLPMELGTLVSVEYEDFENLFNPRITKKVGGPIQIENISSEALDKLFKENIPAVIGDLGDAVPYPVSPTIQYSPDQFAKSKYKANIVDRLNKLDGAVQELFANAIQEFLDTYANEGLDLKISYGYRSLQQQAQLVQTTAGPVAKPGRSWHNYGAAIDIIIVNNGVDETNGDSQSYTVKARNVFAKYGLVNDITNDGGHFYPASLGKAPSKAMRTGGGNPSLQDLAVELQGPTQG